MLEARASEIQHERKPGMNVDGMGWSFSTADGVRNSLRYCKDRGQNSSVGE